jgi:hypothetical protein
VTRGAVVLVSALVRTLRRVELNHDDLTAAEVIGVLEILKQQKLRHAFELANERIYGEEEGLQEGDGLREPS